MRCRGSVVICEHFALFTYGVVLLEKCLPSLVDYVFCCVLFLIACAIATGSVDYAEVARFYFLRQYFYYLILQTRAVISDWLKELSLFDHFLHGLFKFLHDDSDKSKALSGKIYEQWSPTLVVCSFVVLVHCEGCCCETSLIFFYWWCIVICVLFVFFFLLLLLLWLLLVYSYLVSVVFFSSHIVALRPSLEQLSFVAYSAVSKQLPSMLRQWHLTVDRQTSTLVSK